MVKVEDAWYGASSWGDGSMDLGLSTVRSADPAMKISAYQYDLTKKGEKESSSTRIAAEI
jgi:hypothetical protein